MRISKLPFFVKQDYAVWFSFFIILIAGFWTFNDYGQSWDEPLLRLYADENIKNYSSWINKGEIEFEHDWLKYYGPFYFIFTKLTSTILQNYFFIPIPHSDHLIHFLIYFIGIISFHSLAKRWLNSVTSTGITLLFASQPLFWGHAFINPKDSPFMALFLCSVAMGFNLVDKVGKTEIIIENQNKKLWGIHFFWLISVIFIFTFTTPIHNWISELVVSAKSGNVNVITFLASKLSEVPSQVYIQRYFVLFLKVRFAYFILSIVFLLFYWKKFQPNFLTLLGSIFLPAVILGFTTSTRILGPFAGLIVCCYAIYKLKRQSFSILAIYAFIAIVAMYITWPFLWTSPVENFVESLKQMSAYPWNGKVLLNGKTYYSYDLPYIYLPVLFLLQMTEPIWLLVVAGIILAMYKIKRYREIFFIFVLWFLFPFIAFIIFKPVMYDNFRQVLFILPPVFLIIGIALEEINHKYWKTVSIVILLIPNILSIVSLHPYQYIYYNSFASYTRNLHDYYETDYWLTSYREAAEYINQTASPKSSIWVEGPGHLFKPFAREDLIVNSYSSYTEVSSYDYIVVTTRFDFDKTIYPDAEIVYQISRGNSVLAVIKKP